ncbi:MAG: hypothetical protein VKL60_18115 [Sphaerospermopsis sp.]|nr:hypothetical protein [Sphaerospermopsis sp.]
MFEDPSANTNPGQSLLQGYQVGSEHAARQAQLQKYQQEISQKQAMLALGAEAARTADPRAIAMYASVDPQGAQGIRDTAKFFVQRGLGDLQSIKEAKITDRPAIYKMKIAALKKSNPYFDSSEYADEYSPEMDKIIDADLTAGKDLDRQYSLQDTDNGLMLFESKTGRYEPTGIRSLNADKKRLEMQKLNQDIENGGINSEQRFNNASKLRDDFARDSKTFISTREGYDRVMESANNPTAAGDMSLIFGYMKMLDPNSTVREGEYANAESARGVPQSIIARYNKIVDGEKLTAPQRKDFTDRADKLYRRAEASQDKLSKQYTDISKRNKLPVEDVVIDYKTTVKKPENVIVQSTKPLNELSDEELQALRNSGGRR